MPVLVEANSVIIRVDRIEETFPAGLPEFRTLVPNLTFCCDGELARVGFRVPVEAQRFIATLEEHGLIYHQGAPFARDLVMIDQRDGILYPCEWVEAVQLGVGLGTSSIVVLARLKGSLSTVLAKPEGWVFEGSLSDKSFVMPVGAESEFLDSSIGPDGETVHTRIDTGEQIFIDLNT